MQVGQLALAWTMSNKHVSTVITGATTPGQVDENLGAVAFVEHMTPAVLAEIDAALGEDLVASARSISTSPERVEAQVPRLRLKSLSKGALAKL